MNRPRSPRVWPMLAAAMAGILILAGLGVWQLYRLGWKKDLLDRLAAAAAAEPADLATAVSVMAGGGNGEFLKLRLRGTYLHEGEKRLLSTYEGGPGWIVVTPMLTSEGYGILVDRGQVPDQQVESYDRPAGQVEVRGLVRLHRGGQGFFDPDNDPASGAWYWWDVPALLASSRWPAGTRALDFVVQLVPGAAAAPFPRPPEPRAGLANNHLSYAITWFGLAAVLAAVAFLYVRGLMKDSDA